MFSMDEKKRLRECVKKSFKVKEERLLVQGKVHIQLREYKCRQVLSAKLG